MIPPNEKDFINVNYPPYDPFNQNFQLNNYPIAMQAIENEEENKNIQTIKIKKDKSKSKGGIICSACQSETAHLKCNQCPFIPYFCDTCFAFLHKSEPNKSHIPRQISNDNEKENIPKKQHLLHKSEEQINHCSIHTERKLEYFCEECKVPICCDCFISGHKKHDAGTIQDKEKDIRTKISQELKDCQNNIKEILQIKGKIQEKKNEITIMMNYLKQDIINLFEDIQQSLNRKKEELMKKAEEKYEPNYAMLTNLEYHLESVNEKLILHISELENCEKGKNIVHSYCKIQNCESYNIHNIYGNISSFNNEFLDFVKTKFAKPSLSPFDFENNIQKINISFGSNFNYEENNNNMKNNIYNQQNIIPLGADAYGNPDFGYNNQLNYQNLPENNVINLFTLCNFLQQDFNFLSSLINQKKVHKNNVNSQQNYYDNQIRERYLLNHQNILPNQPTYGNIFLGQIYNNSKH